MPSDDQRGLEAQDEHHGLLRHLRACLQYVLVKADWQVGECHLRTGDWDAECVVVDATGTRVRLLVEARLRPSARAIAEGAAAALARAAKARGRPVLFAWRITERVAEACRQVGVSYCDVFGAAWLKWPGLYIELSPKSEPVVRIDAETLRLIEERVSGLPRDVADVLAMRAPRRQRVARVMLCHPQREWNQVDLAREAGVSAATVSKVVKVLVDGLLAEHHGRGPAKTVRLGAPGALLEEWARRWRLGRHGRWQYVALARSPDDARERLASAAEEAQARLGFTLAAGANQYGAYLRDDVVHAHLAGRLDELVGVAGLEPAMSGANVVLYGTLDPGVFYLPATARARLGLRDEVAGRPVCPVQLYLDMKAAGGRYAEQAEHLREEVLGY